MKIFFVLCAFLALGATKRLFHNDQVLRVHPTDEQRDLLEKLTDTFPAIDFWTGPRGSGPVDIHVPRASVGPVKVFLNRHRINTEVFVEDLQKNIDQERSPRPEQMDLSSFDYNVYHTLDEIYQWIDDIASTYSHVATKQIVGTSYEGKPIFALKLSTGSYNRAFAINCGIHAREWVSPASCMHAVQYLVDSTQYLQGIDIYVIPASNPDGYEYTWTGDRMWRKTRSDNNKVCLGVDPNRNWDVNWSGEGASSSSCNDAYYGPSVFSEVEVVAQRDFVTGIPNLKAYIDVHAYSQYWMYPYAWTQKVTADDALLNDIGMDSVAAIKSVHGMTYQTGPISHVIYVASGSTADWFYEAGIKCTFAAELRDTGRYGFTLPERFIQPTAEETFAGLMVIAQSVVDGKCD